LAGVSRAKKFRLLIMGRESLHMAQADKDGA